LNLPQYSFSIRRDGAKELIFDPVRKKYVRLTPEEWVRQNFIQYLVQMGKYPPGLMGIEVMSPYNNLKKRVDILIFNRAGAPVMIVECKNPEVNVDEAVFDQVVTYNMGFKVPYLVVTNGLIHYACRICFEKKNFEFLMAIPLYEDIL
jgi:type I site-specific restriction endonuclease